MRISDWSSDVCSSDLPGSLQTYAGVIQTNLIGSFNTLRLAAHAMAGNPLVDGERGVIIMTASIAAYEGQIGQIPYASSKAGVIGMTLVAARDLASKAIRVCTIDRKRTRLNSSQ